MLQINPVKIIFYYLITSHHHCFVLSVWHFYWKGTSSNPFICLETVGEKKLRCHQTMTAENVCKSWRHKKERRKKTFHDIIETASKKPIARKKPVFSVFDIMLLLACCSYFCWIPGWNLYKMFLKISCIVNYYHVNVGKWLN